MENPIPILYGWVVILFQLLALFAIVIGIAKGFIIYCQNVFSSDRADSLFQASRSPVQITSIINCFKSGR